MQSPMTEPFRLSRKSTLHLTPTIVPHLPLLRDRLSRCLQRRWLGLSGPSLVGQQGARMGFAHNRPQHLKDMIGSEEEGGGHQLLTFTNLILEGKASPNACPYFFGASLVALE